MIKKIKIKLNCSILLISILAAFLTTGSHIVLEQYEHHMHATKRIEEHTGKNALEFDEFLRTHSRFSSHMIHQIAAGNFTEILFHPEKPELIMRLGILFSFSTFGFVISIVTYQKKQIKDNRKNILESISDSIVIVDKNFDYVFVNEAAARLVGRPRSSLKGKNMLEEFPKIVSSGIHEMAIKTMESKKSDCLTSLFTFDDGQSVHIEIHTYPVDDGIMFVTYDVTNKVKLEEELKEERDMLKTMTHDMGERLKELNCLYNISKIVEKPGVELDEIFAKTIDIVQISWQYPEVTAAKIKVIDKIYKTDNWEPSEWVQKSVITSEDNPVGYIEVSYLEKCPESDEGPFMKEERKLINAIAERLGKVIERASNKEDVKELRNLIPICSNCKSIRDDKGYYQTIEEYFTKHTDIELSHTVCDKCVRELYPEYADKLLNGSGNEKVS